MNGLGPGMWLGGFLLEAEIGRGGFAIVYRAQQVRLDRGVAVKVLDPIVARDAEVTRRFEAEGRRAAGLDHPNVIPVFEAGEEDGVFFLAMRLVEGDTLAEELRRARPEPGRTVAILRSVAAALDHAHSRGVLHRDVKPSNILVEGDAVFLADFGIAASVAEVGEHTRGVVGTPAYLAPEQARPGGATPASDRYSFACVAYEMLTGEPPFAAAAAGGVVSVLAAHASDAPPPLADKRLDRILQAGLAKDPAARYPTASAMAEAIASVLAPVEITKPPRRGTGVAIAAVILAAMALAGAAFIGLRRRGPATPATAQPGLSGPVDVADPDGIRYHLPARWRIDTIDRSGVAHVAAIWIGPAAALRISAEPGRADQPSALAAAYSIQCPPSAQVKELFGGVAGVRCHFSNAAQGKAFSVAFASAASTAWTLRFEPGVSDSEVDAFLGDVRFR